MGARIVVPADWPRGVLGLEAFGVSGSGPHISCRVCAGLGVHSGTRTLFSTHMVGAAQLDTSGGSKARPLKYQTEELTFSAHKFTTSKADNSYTFTRLCGAGG